MELGIGILMGATGMLIVLVINVKVFERRRTAATIRNLGRQLQQFSEQEDVGELDGDPADGIELSATLLQAAADALESGQAEPVVISTNGWEITGDIEREK
jgi:hypothetical protein